MRLGVKSGLFSLSLTCLLLAASVSNGAVIGSWTQSAAGANTNFTFNVASDLGNVTSLELAFAPAAGTTFAAEFPDNIFDSDGLLAGFRDSFILFSPAVTSPGATQAKSETKLSAAFTGFTPFASKNVAQLIVVGNPLTPLATDLAATAGRMGTAVIETVPGDANSRQEFPILGQVLNTPPVVDALAPINVAWPNVVTNLQLTGHDAETAANLLTWSNLVADGSNPSGGSNAAPTLGANGLFNWDPTGAKGGTYKFNATVTDTGNPALNGSGLAVTINYTVPEPATLSLFGLALVGFVGMARRRS